MLNALSPLSLFLMAVGSEFPFLPKKLWGRGWSVVMQVPSVCVVQLGFFALYLFLTQWDLFFSFQCIRVFSLPWHRNNVLKHTSVQEILYPVWGGKALISTDSIVFISILTLGVIGTKIFSLGPGTGWCCWFTAMSLPAHRAHICQISAPEVIFYGDCLAFPWEGLRQGASTQGAPLNCKLFPSLKDRLIPQHFLSMKGFHKRKEGNSREFVMYFTIFIAIF